MNNPKRIQFTNGRSAQRDACPSKNVTNYVYSATGEKLRTVYQTAVPNITVAAGERHELTEAEVLYTDSVDYYHGGKVTVKNGRLDKCYFDGGYAQAYPAEVAFNCKPSFFAFEEEDEYEIDDNGNLIQVTSAQSSQSSAQQSSTSSLYDPIYKSDEDAFAFYYYTADHLGNIREVINEDGAVEQTTNYYPFGTPFAEEAGNTNPDLQTHKYNGKEFDTMHGLNTYDYGARQYNSMLGRWDRMDPLCEKYYSVSPYAYCANNPILCVDEKGEEVKVYVGIRNNPENRNLYSLGTRLAAHDNPNSIMIVAHGIYSHDGDYGMSNGIRINAYHSNTDSWQTTDIRNGSDLNKFLSANSQVWKDVQSGKKDASDVKIVLYACGTGNVAQKISSDENFKGVTIIAPNDKVSVAKGATNVSVQHLKGNGVPTNDGVWNRYKGGQLTGKYEGDKNLLPGTNGFKYYDDIKWWEIWKR